MGRKQKKLWKHILLFPASCLILVNVITGCQQSIEHPDLSVRQGQSSELSGTLPAQDSTTELAKMEDQLLDQADALMKSGEISGALQAVAESMFCCEGRFSGRAIEIIKTALAHSDYKSASSANGIRCLRRMEEGVAKSGYGPGPDTGCWLTALGEVLAIENKNQRLKDIIRSQDQKIKTLIKQIAQLKAVDLEPVQPESAIEVP